MRGIGCGAAFARGAIVTSSWQRTKRAAFTCQIKFRKLSKAPLDCKSRASRSLAKPSRMSIETPAKDFSLFFRPNGRKPRRERKQYRKSIIYSNLEEHSAGWKGETASKLARYCNQLSSLTLAHQASYAQFIPRNRSARLSRAIRRLTPRVLSSGAATHS